jgi:large subunit ribosomal protein L25
VKHIEITVNKRDTGKGSARTLRRNKQVPAIVYGQKVKNLPMSTDEISVVRYKGALKDNSLFKFVSEESSLNGLMALMKDYERDPVSLRPVHVDFLAVELSQTVRVKVEVRFDGKALGFAEGGILTIVNRAIEVECKVSDIPENITADISNLNINESLHLSDVKMPNGVKAVSSPDLTLATITIITEEELAAATTASTAAAAGPAAEGAAAEGAAAAPGAAPAAGAAAPAAGAAPAAAAAPAKDDKAKK